MKVSLPSRLGLVAASAFLSAALPLFARGRAPQPVTPPLVMKPARPANRPPIRPMARPGSQEHLAQWMERHSNLSLPDQLRALDNEPGFREYPPQVQQRLRDRLAQLNNMSPQQRSQLLERTEILESHSPEQREQFRAGMQQFYALPQARKALFKRAFRDLREMPPAQRQAVINSMPFRAQFSENERNSLTNVLAVEPYPPLSTQTQGP